MSLSQSHRRCIKRQQRCNLNRFTFRFYAMRYLMINSLYGKFISTRK